MSIMSKLKTFRSILRNQNYYYKVGINKSHDVAELIRYTHSMEKGLCISNPKLGYGHEKQEHMLTLLSKLKDEKSVAATEAKNMAVMSLRRYLEYHDAKNYSDAMIEKIKGALADYPETSCCYGGTVEINKSDLKFNTEEIERFFNTRHSIRDFEKTPVNEEDLKKALVLAQRAPSACNRQGYRAYVLNHDQSLQYAKKLAGIGGFAEDVGRFIMITGKLSAYREDEINQYIVSASMYAAYLTLTLHLYGIGACVVQRPVFYTKEWNNLRNKFSIPADEQIICLLAIGNLKDKMTVPMSYRLDQEALFKLF